MMMVVHKDLDNSCGPGKGAWTVLSFNDFIINNYYLCTVVILFVWLSNLCLYKNI